MPPYQLGEGVPVARDVGAQQRRIIGYHRIAHGLHHTDGSVPDRVS
jgi:hypothetical protein